MNQEDFITMERREYEALLARLNHVESKKRITPMCKVKIVR
jgi:hypothetical protein